MATACAFIGRAYALGAALPAATGRSSAQRCRALMMATGRGFLRAKGMHGAGAAVARSLSAWARGCAAGREKVACSACRSLGMRGRRSRWRRPRAHSVGVRVLGGVLGRRSKTAVLASDWRGCTGKALDFRRICPRRVDVPAARRAHSSGVLPAVDASGLTGANTRGVLSTDRANLIE